MKLVFIYGPAACGKLTVATELAALTGYRLFHNHLVIDVLLKVFAFGSPGFRAAREEMWLSVFRAAAREGLDGMVFTFAPERTVSPGFAYDVIEAVKAEGGEVVFVELTCPIDVIEQRLSSDSRKAYGKLTSVEVFRRLRAEGALGDDTLPEPRLRVDTSVMAPADAAALISARLNSNN